MVTKDVPDNTLVGGVPAKKIKDIKKIRIYKKCGNTAKYYIKKLMKISYIVTGIIGSAVILLLPWILNLYSLSSEARNLTFILVIMHNIMATALHPTAFVLPNGLRAAGDVKFSMVVGIVSMILSYKAK